MATLKEIAYSILESIKGYHITDDNEIPLEWIVKKINDINAILIDEDFKQGKSLESYMQKLCCIEVLCERTECEGIPSGDVIFYSEIPRLNTKIGNKNISYLGLSDMSTSFRRVSYTGFEIGNALSYATRPIYTVLNDKIYYKNLPTTGIKYLCLVGILNDPTTACNWDNDNQYPSPDVYKLELLVKQDILSTYPKIPKDELNDSRDGLETIK